ncbi:hypothetical protein EES40_36490 [Streptomyces sp. ADI93-02]|nr:hypothetical protein EES40_36490 [Streptomyces sp. ADI93-02]
MALRLPSEVDSALIFETWIWGCRRSKARMIRSATTAPRREGISETHQVSRAGFRGTDEACASRSSMSFPPHPESKPAAAALRAPVSSVLRGRDMGELLPFSGYLMTALSP